MTPSPQRGKATLEDIARSAGCSKNTVSLALRDSPRISAGLRRQIRRLADRLHYTTDYAARNLRVRRSGLIGIFTRPFRDAVRTELVNHLLAELHTAQYRPVLGIDQGRDEPCFGSPWMQTFRELRVEALVLLWETFDRLPEWGRSLPVILVGCNPGDQLPCDYLALDRRQAGALGTEHLVARGYRTVLIGAPGQSEFAVGCRSSLTQARCKPYRPPFEIDFTDLQQARLAGYNLARRAPRPLGAIFADSGYAAHFMRGVFEARRKVPDHLGIVGYDYFPWAEILSVPLTTIEQPIRTMASTAVELIRRRLAQPDLSPAHIVQPHTLVIRGSS